jgi:hypothetical protein
MDDAARKFLFEDQSEQAMEIRFELFMDELEAHAHPTFGHGRMPEINSAAQALIKALETQFLERRETAAPTEVWKVEGECS